MNGLSLRAIARMACGAELRRDRRFEASFPIGPPKCQLGNNGVIGVHGGHYRDRRRPGGQNRGEGGFTADDDRTAMQIDWMTGDEAIPPAYSEFIARDFLRQRQSTEEAA